MIIQPLRAFRQAELFDLRFVATVVLRCCKRDGVEEGAVGWGEGGGRAEGSAGRVPG